MDFGDLIIIAIGLMFVGFFSIGCYIFWTTDPRWRQFLLDRIQGKSDKEKNEGP